MVNKNTAKIVFMGTPEFAAIQLQTLVERHYEVVGVVTMPDKPAGRGLQPQASAVKLCAQKYNLPLLQPEKLRDEDFLRALESLHADIFVVVAFRMLPEVVWQMPRLGTFNLHASLLPQYRGAAPINWAIINGEKETGVTSFLIDKNMDTGNILLQQSVPILPSDNAETVHDQLMLMGANVIMQTIDGLSDGTLQAQAQQDSETLKTAPKLFKENTKINPENSAEDLVNFVRGLSPYPVAWLAVSVDGEAPQIMKVYESQAELDDTTSLPIGTLLRENDALKLRCKDGFLNILSLQMPGKKRMRTQDFLRGMRKELALK